MSKANTIIEILMRRDSLTRKEATDLYKATCRELDDAFTGENGRDPEEILLEDLGLELDYIYEFI